LFLLPFVLQVVLASAANVLGLEPINADCRGEVWSRGELHIRYFSAGQSCPPGGPCSLMGIRNLPPSEVRLLVQGCKRPLPGRFVDTGRSCRRARLLRYDGVVPPGRDLTLTGPRTSYGFFRSPGRRQPLDCSGARPPSPALMRDVMLLALDPGGLPSFCLRQLVPLSAAGH